MTMLNMSPGVTGVWQIAVGETVHAKRQYIEPEQVLIGLFKLGDFMHPEIQKQISLSPAEIETLKFEVDLLDRIFNETGTDKAVFHRRLRELAGQGNYSFKKEKVVHRTEDCKRHFQRAEEIAKSSNFQMTNVLHLYQAILESPTPNVSELFKEKNIDPENVKNKVVESIASDAKNGGVKPPRHSKTPTLDRYGKDLTRLAKEGKIELLIGRRNELLQVIRTLTRKTKSNPVLVGDAGVGKTAIVEGLAIRIASKNLTESLWDNRLIELSMSAITAGTKYRGQFEERLNNIMREADQNPDVILFIDEIHTMVGAGAGEGGLDAANILKPALARGAIRCIGATTLQEYRKHIEKDPALERRFQPITVEEPSVSETMEILTGLKQIFEEHRGITIQPEAIAAAVELSVKYLKDHRLPDKAIDLLDEACSRIKVEFLSFRQDANPEPVSNEVTKETIAEVLSEKTGIPVNELTKTEAAKLLKLEDNLKEIVIGQDHAVKKVAERLRLSVAGLKDCNKPAGVFLFLGPTGVGKTALAKTLAEVLFDSHEKMIRLDMSEYMEKHSVSKLTGSPPGYVGHEEEGQLTGKLRRHPYSLVLLDEVEKAHPEIWDIFLQVFDDGRLTDSKGRTVDATNAIFIMTSNIGNELFKNHIGFLDKQKEADLFDKAMVELKKTFRPEFINRIDEVVFFNELSKEHIKQIAFNLLGALLETLKAKSIGFDIEDPAYEILIEEGYNRQYGVRFLIRVIEHLISKPISEKLLSGEIKQGDNINVDVEEGKICLRKNEDIFDFGDLPTGVEPID